MFDYFQRKRSEILAFLAAQVNEIAGQAAPTGRWGPDALHRILEFTSQGKMIRGGLVILAHDLFKGRQNPEAVVAAAAAMELFQSSFLIHDDIMDRDEVRRGKPAVFHAYARLGEDLGVGEPLHFGESLGICSGDIAIFLAFEVLAKFSGALAGRAGTDAVAAAARELLYVGCAQMEDVYYGLSPEEPDEEAILRVYRYKTGRYTFSLPLGLGGRLAGAGEEALGLLASLGESYGILFQIKDDELGLWGDEGVLGKPVGSDIAENKKTLFRLHLLASATPAERGQLATIFGRKALGAQEIHQVRELMARYAVAERVRATMLSCAEEARSRLQGLMAAFEGQLSGEEAALLGQLLEYNLTRER